MSFEVEFVAVAPLKW